MKEKQVALYHRVMRRENFEKAAKDLVDLLVLAQKKSPGKPRTLYVDIDGHRNAKGGFDQDMLELQKEFGLGFLLPFFTEVHFPLISVKNPNKQDNDVPDKLHIFNPGNQGEDSLGKLRIENYSNTEFASEEDVHGYLVKVSAFLRKYCDMDIEYALMDKEEYDRLGVLSMWRRHIRDQIIELYNVFLGGNLLSAAAMTRTLIECYAYVKLLKQEKSAKLLEKWCLCSLWAGATAFDEVYREKIFVNIEKFCRDLGWDYAEASKQFKKGYGNEWLADVIPKRKTSFKSVCEYLSEHEMYTDYSSACAFVHGQSIVAKMSPFTFYSSIYTKLYLMMTYIFKAIRLFPLSGELEEEMRALEEGLIELGAVYLK